MERIFYSDGGCRPTNPGPGGWGWIEITSNTIPAHQSGYENNVTNNIMELKAMLNVLKFLDGTTDNAIIYCDSNYVVQILTNWGRSWEKNGWTRAKGKEIENLALVKEIYHYYNKNIWNVQVSWVRGHCGNAGNELVDALTWSEEKFINLAKEKGFEIL